MSGKFGNGSLFSKNIIAFIIVSSGLHACYSSKLPLTPKEVELGIALAREFRREVAMEHDKNALVENRTDGAHRLL